MEMKRPCLLDARDGQFASFLLNPAYFILSFLVNEMKSFKGERELHSFKDLFKSFELMNTFSLHYI